MQRGMGQIRREVGKVLESKRQQEEREVVGRRAQAKRASSEEDALSDGTA